HASAMIGAAGRVLPMSRTPLNIQAQVRGDDPTRPDQVSLVRGQHAVAVSRGAVEEVRLLVSESSAFDGSPEAGGSAEPVACVEAIEAVKVADWLIFGPGSWFTSVIPHLLVPDLATAIASSSARRLVTLNLAAELETAGLSLPDHLRALARYLPGLRVDVVLADGKAVGDPVGLQTAAESLRARVVLAPVAVADGGPRHDPAALANALHDVLGAR
ncbi:MAG TPA: 2-phospho-L-lactate transferase CofD family protein, partial [Micromonosporaceae bacterium]